MIYIPYEKRLVVLVGPAGCGKSTYAARYFQETEIISSDECRRLVSDCTDNQDCNSQAFQLFHTWIEARLKFGKTAVADATNLTGDARKKLRTIASELGITTIALVLDVPLTQIKTQNQGRIRIVPEKVIDKHWRQFQDVKKRLTQEFDQVFFINLETKVYRHPVATGFDIIGDIHGCFDEFYKLLMILGYEIDVTNELRVTHPEGRKPVFVGDITDRGPANHMCFSWIYHMVNNGYAYWVMGNHDNKLYRALKGNNVSQANGLQQTMREFAALNMSEESANKYWHFISNLPYKLRLHTEAAPPLYVTHAGVQYKDRDFESEQVKSDCLYGPGTTQTDGRPQRSEEWCYEWPNEKNNAWVVYGHIACDKPKFINNTVCIDTGCVLGGHLSAFLYPELTTISVKSTFKYEEPCKETLNTEQLPT